jgi:hypothetical protein
LRAMALHAMALSRGALRGARFLPSKWNRNCD